MKVYRDGSVWDALRSINDEIDLYWHADEMYGTEDEVYIENLETARTALRKVLLDQGVPEMVVSYFDLTEDQL